MKLDILVDVLIELNSNFLRVWPESLPSGFFGFKSSPMPDSVEVRFVSSEGREHSKIKYTKEEQSMRVSFHSLN